MKKLKTEKYLIKANSWHINEYHMKEAWEMPREREHEK